MRGNDKPACGVRGHIELCSSLCGDELRTQNPFPAGGGILEAEFQTDVNALGPEIAVAANKSRRAYTNQGQRILWKQQ